MNKTKKNREKCSDCKHFIRFPMATEPGKFARTCTCDLSPEMVIDIHTKRPEWCRRDKVDGIDSKAAATMAKKQLKGKYPWGENNPHDGQKDIMVTELLEYGMKKDTSMKEKLAQAVAEGRIKEAADLNENMSDEELKALMKDEFEKARLEMLNKG